MDKGGAIYILNLMVGGEKRFVLLEHRDALGAGLGVQLLVQIPITNFLDFSLAAKLSPIT